MTKRKFISRKRILKATAASTWSKKNLFIQKFKFSAEQLSIPSAELNSVCSTSPPKLWKSLSNICTEITEVKY